MKTFLKAFVVFCVLLVPLCVFGDSIPTEGTWTDKGIRTLIPSPPSASIAENSLSIFIAKPLTKLTVQVTDLNGKVVYEECISSYENNFTYNIKLNAPAGEYQIRLVHNYGTLVGNFNIN